MQPIPYWRLSALYFTYFATVGAISPYWSVYLHSLGFSGTDIGLVIALPMLTRLVAPNVWGWLADKSGRHLKVIQFGSVLACISFTGLFFAEKFWSVVFFTSLFTFFWNAILPQFEVVTLDHLNTQAHYYGKIRLWGSIGFIVAVVILGMAFEIYSTRILLYVIFIMLFGILFCALSLVEPKHQVFEESGGDGFLVILRNRNIASFFLAALFLQVSHGALYGFYSLYLLDNGYDSWLIGCLWALGVVAEIILFLKVPSIFARYTLKTCFLLSIAAAVVRWLLLSQFVELMIIVVVLQVLHALTFGLAHSVAIEFVRQRFPVAVRGKAQAFYSAICFGAGGAAGAYISGYYWTVAGHWCFLSASIFALISFLIAFFGMRKY